LLDKRVVKEIPFDREQEQMKLEAGKAEDERK